MELTAVFNGFGQNAWETYQLLLKSIASSYGYDAVAFPLVRSEAPGLKFVVKR